MSQYCLAVQDDVHIKSQVFTLKWWKHLKCDQLWKAVYMQNLYVNDDSITLREFCHSLQWYDRIDCTMKMY